MDSFRLRPLLASPGIVRRDAPPTISRLPAFVPHGCVRPDDGVRFWWRRRWHGLRRGWLHQHQPGDYTFPTKRIVTDSIRLRVTQGGLDFLTDRIKELVFSFFDADADGNAVISLADLGLGDVGTSLGPFSASLANLVISLNLSSLEVDLLPGSKPARIRIGAPVERGLEAAKLPVEQAGGDTLVTVHSLFSFVHSMGRREGIDNLGVEIGLSVQEQGMGPLRETIALAPTLLEGLRVSSRFARAEGSHVDFGLEERGDSVLFWHRGPHDDHPGFPQMETYFVQVLLGCARAFLGAGWEAPVIGLESPRVPEKFQAAYPGSRVLVAQPLHFIEIPRALLSRPPVRRAVTRDASPPSTSELPSGFAESLGGLLESYVSDGKLSLGFAAELAGLSTRTLQRQLRAAGVSFSDLVGSARYRVAARMLEDPAHTVTDVAHFVGYDDSSHFTRAFRRMAGVPPTDFRRSATPGVA